MTWARSQSGRIEITKEPLNLLSIVNKSIETHSPSAGMKNILIKNNVSGELNVTVDKFTISVVLNNLISNAIKFTDIGGQISINAKQIGNHVELGIEDTGVGIDAGNIKNLFKLSKNRSKRGTVNESGSGLGLILVKDFIKKNGGEIWVKSKLGVGSVFSFSIPIR